MLRVSLLYNKVAEPFVYHPVGSMSAVEPLMRTAQLTSWLAVPRVAKLSTIKVSSYALGSMQKQVEGDLILGIRRISLPT